MKNLSLREKQKEEALCRMRLLGLNEDIITMFDKKGMITESINRENGKRILSSTLPLKHKKLVEEIEDKYGILVYHVIHLRDLTRANGFKLPEALNMLYVCKYELDWPLDRQAAKEKDIYVYHLDLENKDYSEYGLIGIDVIENSLIKRLW